MTTFDAAFATLTGIVRRTLANPDLDLDPLSTSRSIVGWNSFKYVEIILELETEYDITLDGQDIDEVRNIGDLAELVVMKTAATAGARS